jgi:hypothetical protein
MATTDAKNSFRVYMQQLCLTLAPAFNQEYYAMYRVAATRDHEHRVEVFLKMLNNEQRFCDNPAVAEFIQEIESKTPWLRNMLKQMVTHQIVILMSTKYDKSNTEINVDFELPATFDILKRMFCYTTLKMRAYVGLYDHALSETQRAVNSQLAEKHIKKFITEAFAHVVPFEQIVRQHLSTVAAVVPAPMLASEAPMQPDETPTLPVEVSIEKEPEPPAKRAKRAKIEFD